MSDAKQILYIEDNPGDVRLFEKMVAGSSIDVEIYIADRLSTGIKMIDQTDFDAIFMDLGLPDSQGLDSMTALIQHCAGIPVIVLTGHEDADVGIQAIQAGAQDYLVKGIDYAAMFHRIIRNAIERKDIEDRLRTSEERVTHLNSILRAIRDVNQLITHETRDRFHLVQGVCDHLVRALDFHIVWIALRDGKRKYRGFVNAEFQKLFQPFFQPLTRGALPVCTEKEFNNGPVELIKNVTVACEKCPGSKFSPTKSAFITRLQSHGKVYGFLAAYIPDYFVDDGEVQDLFAALGDDIAFALYKFDIEDHRKAAEEKIRASLIEKEMLLKEIHHRVKNNLQVITSLINLQSANISDKRVLRVFRESQHRIHSIALVHEKLYKSENLSEIDFGSYATSIVQELIRAYSIPDKLNIKVDIDHVYIGIDNAIPLGLVINELITNALKYAFPNQGKGQITISLKSVSDQDYELTVADNGAGMDKDVIIKDKGLGLQLVGILAEQLGGHLKIECNNGSRFILRFPRPQR